MAEEKMTSDTIFKIGSKGDEVGKIQTALGDYYTKFGAKVDNDYGNDTAGGVWDWQTQWNKDNPNDQIKVDGIVGPQTYPRLMQWAATKSAPAGNSSGKVKTPAAEATGTVTNTDGAPGSVQPADYTFTGAQLAQMGPSVEDNKYLTDWSKVTNVYDEAKKLNVPLVQVLQDYQRWGNETGNPTFWVNSLFQDADLTKSATDNEEEKKRLERKERWDKVNNFLLHLGNVIGNVGSSNYGSVKLEDPVQWTERQRMLKEKALEQRRLNNQSLLTQLNRDRENQRAYELKKQQAEANAAYRQAMTDAAIQKAIANNQVSDATVKLREAQANQTEKLTPVKVETEKSKAEKNRRPSSGRRATGKQDSETNTTYERDADGRVTRSKRTTTYGNATQPAAPKQSAQQREAAKKKWASKKTKK
jgi:hypothetical protein